MIVSNFETAACFPVNAAYSEMMCSQDEKCSAIYSSPLIQKKVNFLAERADKDSDIVIEVAENQEESVNESMMSSSRAGGNNAGNFKQSFSHEEMEANRLQWAAAKFYPYTEDVFSLGLTILQVAYQCSGPELKQMRQDPETMTQAVEQMGQFYSENLCCILMLMLQWESE